MILILISILTIANAEEPRKDLVAHPNWKIISKYLDECGENMQDRIIGGINASIGQYPWLARLGYSYGFNPDKVTVDMYECGGAIITDRYILTAAHCSPKIVGIDLVQVRLGEHYTETDPDCVDGVCAPPVQDIGVESYRCHERYNKKNFQNDVCLIRLARPIKLNNFVQPICLPVYNDFLNNTFEKFTMEVAGWGIYDIAIGEPNTILQTVKVPIVNHKKCKAKYKKLTKITKSQMCAGGVIGKDSCGGDSGGPLMMPFSFDAPPKYYVVAIVSFGLTKCGATDSPGVYSKISVFLPWILDNIKP